MLLSIILQAGLGKALFGIAAAIAAFAAAFGLRNIGKAAIDAGAGQHEFAGKYQKMAIIVGAFVEGACLFAILVCLLGVLK